MSERKERKQYQELVSDQLRALRSRQQQDAALIVALEKSQEIFAEVPKKELECVLHESYAQYNGTLVSRWCSECQDFTDGAQELGPSTARRQKFCPFCGSRVQGIETESSPSERLTVAAATSATSRLMEAFAK